MIENPAQSYGERHLPYGVTYLPLLPATRHR